MINYIHLSPHFPSNYYQFSLALNRSGARVLGIGDTPWDNLRQDLKESLTEYYKVDDLHNTDQLIAALEYFTNRYGQIDGIDSHNEYWLETEAMLRSRFNIPGLQQDQLTSIRKKSEMKKIFRAAGLRVAAGTLATDFDEAKEFIKVTGYPIIAKPDTGVGAADTYKIQNEDDLLNFFATKPPVVYIMEEFINGDVVSFDGLAGKDGQPLFFSAMQNEKGVMEVVHQDSHVYYYTLRNIPPDLEQAGRKVLEAFGVKGRFFHFEFFREHKTGDLVALEVNMRPPGGFTTDMFNFSCDIDIYQAWADLVTNKIDQIDFERKFHVCFVSRKYRYDYAISHDELMQRFGQNIVFHSNLDHVLARAMGDSCYLVRSESLENIFEIQKEIHRLM